MLQKQKLVIEPIHKPPLAAGENFSALVEAARAIFLRMVPEKFLEEPSHLHKIDLPLIEIDISKENVGHITVSLIERIGGEKDPGAMHFHNLLCNRLLPGKLLSAQLSQSLDFKLQMGRSTPMRLSQVTFNVGPKNLGSFQAHIDLFKRELKLVLKSAPFSYFISETRALPLSEKKLAVCEYIARIIERHPTKTRHIFTHVQWMMAAWIRDFCRERKARALTRLTVSAYLFYDRLKSKQQRSHYNRELYLDLFPIHLNTSFGSQNALALCTVLSFIKDGEVFSEEHVLKGVQSIFPDVCLVEGSFFASHLSEPPARLVYLEVRKPEGAPFSRREISRLRQILPAELKGRVEKLIHPVFIPRNDEELLHHIGLLSRELRVITDLPQVMISFDQQAAEKLLFSLIVVRVRKPGDLDSEEILTASSQKMHISLHLIKIIGHLRDVHPKEAIVFNASLDKKGYLRKDGSIDLLRARQTIATSLTHLIGDIRDLNGGMIIKQSEAFARLKENIGPLPADTEFLLENFFYSITPITLQGVLAAKPLALLFHLVQEAIKSSSGSVKNELVHHRFISGQCMLVISTAQDNLKEYIDASIEQIAQSDLDIASSEVHVDSRTYIAYLYSHHDASRLRLFLTTAKEALEKWKLRTARRQVLRLNIPKGILSLDPRIGGDQQSGIVKRMLYDGLMRLDKTGTPTQALAQRVKISDDHLTYTFTLQPARWSNGDPIIAYDFEYAWKKVLDPSFQTAFAFVFYAIKNARAANEGRLSLDEVGVRALDEKTLEVSLEQPSPYFLELTAHWAYSPVSSKSDIIHPGWAHTGAETYASSGPFKLSLFDYGRRIEFVKNPLYWDAGRVKLEKIELTMVQDPYVEMKMYENNEIEWAGQPFSVLPFETAHKLKRENKLFTSPTAATTWLDFNVENFPFNNKKMRQAFSIGFCRERLTQEVIPGRNAPATGVLPLSMSVQTEPYFKDCNTEMARALFDEALRELGCTKEQLPQISILCAATEHWKEITKEVKRQLDELFEIDICIRAYPWDEFFNHRSNNFFQISGISWYCWYNDPAYVLEVFKYRSNPLNSTQWENPQYISWLHEASIEKDPVHRKQLLQQAERLLINEMAVMPLFHDGDCYMRKEYLKGLSISKTGDIDFKEAYIEHG